MNGKAESTYSRATETSRGTGDFLGGESVTWSKVDDVWANAVITAASEEFEQDANKDVTDRHAEVLIRWRPDLVETMRVIHNGLTWDIEGIEQVGFHRESLLFVRTDVS